MVRTGHLVVVFDQLRQVFKRQLGISDHEFSVVLVEGHADVEKLAVLVLGQCHGLPEQKPLDRVLLAQ